MALNSATDVEAFLNDHVIPGKVADNIGDASAGLKLFLSSGKTVNGASIPQTNDELLVGGKYVRRHVRHSRNSERGSFKGYDVLNVDPVRQYDYVREEMSSYYVPLSWAWDDTLFSRGGEAIKAGVDKMVNDLDSMISDMMDLWATGIYNSAASRTGLQAKGIHGLREVASVNRTWWGLDSTSETWWDGYTSGTAHTLANMADSTHASYIFKLIRSLIDNTSVGMTRPTAIITTQANWNVLEDMLKTHYQTQQVRTADIGHEFISVKGVPVFWDAYCPAYHMFSVNFKGIGNQRPLGIKGRRDAWFKLTEWRKPHNQMAQTRFLLAQGVMFCDNPRLIGSLTSVGAS